MLFGKVAKLLKMNGYAKRFPQIPILMAWIFRFLILPLRHISN